jgi:hypothetical protein
MTANCAAPSNDPEPQASSPFAISLTHLDDLLSNAFPLDGSAVAAPTTDESPSPRTERTAPIAARADCDLSPVAALEAISEPRLAWLARAFGLSPFECDVFLLALAPEIDIRYGHIYGRLQNDASLCRPLVGFVLQLLCPGLTARLQARVAFAADAPLVRRRLLELVSTSETSSLLTRTLRVDEQIAHYLLCGGAQDSRIGSFCEHHVATKPSGVQLAELTRCEPALRAVREALDDNDTAAFLFMDLSARDLIESFVASHGSPLLVCDLARLDATSSFVGHAALVFREAWLSQSVLLVDGVWRIGEAQHAPARTELARQLAQHPGIVILVGNPGWSHDERLRAGVQLVELPAVAATDRQRLWQAAIDDHRVVAKADDVAALAVRYRLSAPQIEAAVETARRNAPYDAGEWPVLSLSALLDAARCEPHDQLRGLLEPTPTRRLWSDLVLPAHVTSQLEELCARVSLHHTVFGTWRFDQALSLGRGVTALFSGPSGSGKTLAAEVVAHELQLDLYRINLAGVVSKYIGETEKNLEAIFSEAERANAILLFDEADAIFGKRSEVQDAKDRYANTELSYLLQRLESYDGVAILTTNLRHNIDEAFLRRLTFSIHFPFPNDDLRKDLWSRAWPAEAPVAGDIDVDLLARRFRLSGGNIRNAALAAAFLAAGRKESIGMSHVLVAVRRELEKFGTSLPPDEMLPNEGTMGDGK